MNTTQTDPARSTVDPRLDTIQRLVARLNAVIITRNDGRRTPETRRFRSSLIVEQIAHQLEQGLREYHELILLRPSRTETYLASLAETAGALYEKSLKQKFDAPIDPDANQEFIPGTAPTLST